ncbi:MAG: DotU family type IV/VI secretion system protein [Myxococcaceae bacterium]
MQRITEVTKDCFGALLQLSQLDNSALASPDALYQRVQSHIDQLWVLGKEAGYSQGDIQDMAYALVALADELGLSQSDAIRDFWMSRPLQFHFFKENQAGEGFFQRLGAIQRDSSRVDVLQVYYLCLLFGFQGRYRVRGGELELFNLTEAVGKELVRARRANAEVLSPHGARPSEVLTSPGQSGPLLAWSGAALGIALLLFGGLRLGLGASASNVVDQLQASTARR